jgi:hypothetical protein
MTDDASAPTEVPETIETTVAASTQDLPHAYAILAGSDVDTVGHAVVVCERACMALFNFVYGSKENTVLLLSLGGGVAVANVTTKWPDDAKIQTV